MRGVFLFYPVEMVPVFFAALADSLKALCVRRKFLGGEIGFTAILHTWTRRMLFHPHIHVLVPAVGLAPRGCELRHPRNEEYLLPEKALAHATRKAIKEPLARDHPEIFARIKPAAWQKPWVAQAQGAGRGRTALRYLSAYVKKSAFSEGRLLDYDQSGRIVLSYRDSANGKLKSEALDPLELIRRWLVHALPKGLVRVRHYGWLSPAAHKAFLRVRFLLGLGPHRIPALPKSELPRCPFSQRPALPHCKDRASTRPAIVPSNPQGRRMNPVPTIRALAAAGLTRSKPFVSKPPNNGRLCLRRAPILQIPSRIVLSLKGSVVPPPPRRTTEALAAPPTARSTALSTAKPLK